MQRFPLVTFGLPICHEPIESVEFAIRSIYAQTYANWELVVVSDGAEKVLLDRIRQIDDERVRVFDDGTNRGLAHRLNQITRESSGELITRVDADDALHPDKLEKQVKAGTPWHSEFVVGSRTVIVNQDFKPEGLLRSGVVDPRNNNLMSQAFASATALASREWFERNPYDETMSYSEDRAQWLRTWNISEFKLVREPLYFYRLPRPLLYSKYAAYSKYTRKALLKYGHNVANRRTVVKECLRTFAKQAYFRVSTVTGNPNKIYDKRLEYLDDRSKLDFERVITEIGETNVPGWGDRG